MPDARLVEPPDVLCRIHRCAGHAATSSKGSESVGESAARAGGDRSARRGPVSCTIAPPRGAQEAARAPRARAAGDALASVSASSALARAPWRRSDPVQAGSPVDGSIRWWAKPPSRALPHARVEPGGGDAAAADRHRGRALARERVLDLDLVGSPRGVGAADAHVAAAVHDEARVAAQHVGHGVGAEALAAPPRVEAHTRRAVDQAGDRRPPAAARQRLPGCWTRGAAPRRAAREGLGRAGAGATSLRDSR